jgi:hypothetical protein
MGRTWHPNRNRSICAGYVPSNSRRGGRTTTRWKTTLSFVPAAISAAVSTARPAGPEQSTATTIVPNIELPTVFARAPAGRPAPGLCQA